MAENYGEMLYPETQNAEAPATMPNPTQGHNALQQPIDPVVQQMMRPAQSAEEVERRKGGWLEFIGKLTSDPNLMRAVGQFGAALAQPRGFGQSPLGQFGQAMNVGTAAYGFGQDAQMAQDLRLREEARKQAESQAQVGLVQAQTETERQRPAYLQSQTAHTDAQKNVMLGKLQSEIDLLEAQVGQTKSLSEANRALARLNAAKATVEETYGANDAQASIVLKMADAAYRSALARYQDAHAKLTNSQIDQGKGDWKLMGMKYDNETGVGVSETYNAKTNARRRIITSAPMSLAAATAKAKEDVESQLKLVPAPLWGTNKEQLAHLSSIAGAPVKSKEEAVIKLAQKYIKGGQYIVDISADGNVTSREVFAEDPSSSAPLHPALAASKDYANAPPHEQAAMRELVAKMQGGPGDYRTFSPAITGSTPAAAAPGGATPPGQPRPVPRSGESVPWQNPSMPGPGNRMPPTPDELRAMGWTPGQERTLYDDVTRRPVGTVNPDGSVTWSLPNRQGSTGNF